MTAVQQAGRGPGGGHGPGDGQGPAGRHGRGAGAGTTAAGSPGQSGRIPARLPRFRAWVAIGLLVVAAAVCADLLSQQPGNPYLNPGSTGQSGTRALADVLAGLGRQVTTETSAGSAAEAATAGSTLVVTSPYYLTAGDLRRLAATPADVVLVEPGAAALAAFHTGLQLVSSGAPVASIPAACTLYAAVLAGTADLGGTLLAPVSGGRGRAVQQCYPMAGDPSLVQLTAGGRLVTILGTGYPLTNGALAQQGNAALAIDLLPSRRIVWLVPPVTPIAAASPAGPRSFFSLVPLPVYLVAVQLAIALALAAAWRARRLGPLVAEPLPVVVAATETVEGHGQLYQSRRARARAAGELRAAALRRIGPVAGLPPRAGQDAVVAALSARSQRSPEQIAELLYGPAPRSDQALVNLARDIDQVEREAGGS